MQLILYINNQERNVLNKTLNNENALILEGFSRNQLSITNPVIELEGDETILQYNYCFIPELSRYFFVEKIVALSDKRYLFYMSIDVLKTYENQIKELHGEITRNSTPTKYKCEPTTLDTYQEKKITYDNPFNFEGNNILISVTSERTK